MTFQTNSIDKNGLARTPDGKLYVTSVGTASITGTSSTGFPVILAQSWVDVSCPADSTEDTLATIPLPAGMLGSNGGIRVTCQFTFTNSVNNKTVRVRFGGTQVSGAVYTTTTGAHGVAHIFNKNATGSQQTIAYLISDSGTVNVNKATPAIDSTALINVTITGQKATSGETLTLNGYIVEYMKLSNA